MQITSIGRAARAFAGRRSTRRVGVLGAVALAAVAIAQPLSVNAGFDAASIGTRTDDVALHVMVKTPAAPNANIPPAPAEVQFFLTNKCPKASCFDVLQRIPCLYDGCVNASSNSNASDCQVYRSDYACTGYDPVAEQCDQDADTVAAHTWHADYGPTLSSWERWSSSCQSNWSAYGDTDGGTVTAWAQYGTGYDQGVSSTSYTANGTYVYGQLLYGGSGTYCVTALGNQGYFEDQNGAYYTTAGCV